MEQEKKLMKVSLVSGNLMNLYHCPRCTCGLHDKPKFCPNCGQHVIYPWDGEWKLLNYADYDALKAMIDKMDNTPAPELEFDVNEHLCIYNWLKELEEYRKIGTLRNVANKEELL